MQRIRARCEFCSNTSAPELGGRPYYQWGDDCYLCPKIPWKLVAMAGMVLATLVAFARWTTPNWTVVAAVKQFVSFSQNLDIVGLISIQWPKIFITIMTAFKVVAADLGDVASPECWGASWTWHDRFTSTTASFVGAGILLAVFTRTATRWGWRTAEAKLKRLLLLLFTATYTTTTTLCMKSFQSVGENPTLFLYDTNVKYYAEKHLAVMSSAAFLLIVVLLGLPVFLGYFARALLNEDRLRDPDTKRAWGSIYDCYSSGALKRVR